MKSALMTLGALALGATALYWLDPKRTGFRRHAHAHGGGSWRTARYSGPDARHSRPAEPAEIEEIAGSPGVSPSGSAAAPVASDIGAGTSGIGTPGAPTSGTGAYGLSASGSPAPAAGASGSGHFSLPPYER